MKNILVAIDFEEKTRLLLDNARQLAEKFGSKIWIIHIADTRTGFVTAPVSYHMGIQYLSMDDVKTKEMQRERKIVQGYVDELVQQGFQAEGMLVEGPTVKMILDEAHELHIDLIIIGSHKHSFLFNELIGTITASVMRKSPIPMLIVPME